MGRRQRVQYSLDAGNIKELPKQEIKMILRAADELISTGGRNMLVKTLKGSRDKKVLEHHLDECPAYGFYQSLTLEEISHRVDWMIENDYIRIDYYGQLPMLVFSEKGWAIEKETFAEEIYQRFCLDLKEGKESVILEMKDANRQVVYDVLEKIRSSKNSDFIPMLEAWKKTEVRKVRERISSVEKSLNNLSLEPQIEYRKAVKKDTREIMELVHKTVLKIYPKYYPGEVVDFFCMYHSKERIQADIQSGNVWLLLCDGRCVGTGSLDGNHITRVYVLPEFQRKGYGSRIMCELEKQIHRDCDSVVVDASLPACCLYEKLGYSTVRHERMTLMNGVILVYEVMEKRFHAIYDKQK